VIISDELWLLGVEFPYTRTSFVMGNFGGSGFFLRYITRFCKCRNLLIVRHVLYGWEQGCRSPEGSFVVARFPYIKSFIITKVRL